MQFVQIGPHVVNLEQITGYVVVPEVETVADSFGQLVPVADPAGNEIQTGRHRVTLKAVGGHDVRLSPEESAAFLGFAGSSLRIVKLAIPHRA